MKDVLISQSSRLKLTLIMASCVSMLSFPSLTGAQALAASDVKDIPTTITMMGQSSIEADHVAKADPWSGQQTSWVPLYYLTRVLQSVGVQSMWDGNSLTITSMPKGWSVHAKKQTESNVVPAGQLQFLIGGHPETAIRAPKLVAKDPASGSNTTYVPIYYADSFLRKQLSMGAVWTGPTWTLAPQPVIAQTTYTSETSARQHVQSLLKNYLNFGPDSQSVNLGLGITAKGEGALSHAGLQWHEGNWTVEVLWFGGNQGGQQLAERVVSYLHTHMLPPPRNTGSIVISSADWTSTKLQPTTTIAWQEGNVVYQIETLESPLEALKTAIDSYHG